MGVDIIQQCEVTAILTEAGAVTGVETTKGPIRTEKVACVTAGHTSVIAKMVGLRLPIESHPLQALVSEPIKPILPCVVMSNAVHVYVSQSDKGELVIGAGIDPYVSYTQRGSLDIIEHQMAALIELFPFVSRLRMMRQWGGIVDVCPDASPIISKTPVKGFYINGGWGTGGWKATPGFRPRLRRSRGERRAERGSPRRSRWSGSRPARSSRSTAPRPWRTEMMTMTGSLAARVTWSSLQRGEVGRAKRRRGEGAGATLDLTPSPAACRAACDDLSPEGRETAPRLSLCS